MYASADPRKEDAPGAKMRISAPDGTLRPPCGTAWALKATETDGGCARRGGNVDGRPLTPGFFRRSPAPTRRAELDSDRPPRRMWLPDSLSGLGTTQPLSLPIS